MRNLTDFQKHISTLLPKTDLRFEQKLAEHTSFRIGGPAEVMAFPKSTEELSVILKTSALLDCKTYILGAGTNVLAPDAGLRGLVICLKDCLTGMEKVGETSLRVSVGVTMSRAAVFAAGLGLSGLEFAHGIPGTVGGGVYMNAGAYGGEISQVCSRVWVMSMDGAVTEYTGEEMGFSYRHSRLEWQSGIVTAAEFTLSQKPEEEIRELMRQLMQRRKEKQPLDRPSAGSAFKRPAGGYAAALIDEAGLKGFRIGGAAVSEKHAGFVVNLGDATADDVKRLLEQVSDKVYAASGVRLEPEVRIW